MRGAATGGGGKGIYLGDECSSTGDKIYNTEDYAFECGGNNQVIAGYANGCARAASYGAFIAGSNVHFDDTIILTSGTSKSYGIASDLSNIRIRGGRIDKGFYKGTGLTDVVIKDVSGYDTENSGNSTGTGAEQTIAHGLEATPNRVILWNIEDGANPYQSTAADATNIYITAVVDKDYGWEALVR